MNEPSKIPPIHVDSFWLPRQGSTIAKEIDFAWDVVLWVSVVFFVLLMGMMFYFAVRYRRRTDHDLTSDLDHNTRLEVLWTVIPLAICIGLFFVGFKGFVNASVPPAEALEIQVVAQRWSWSFTYPNGITKPELVVPRGRPVKLIMSSKDVLHSFWVPELRVKRDIVPGQYTTVWFEATHDTETVLQCAEYCGGAGKGEMGSGHSMMLATVRVVDERAYEETLQRWDEMDNNLPPAELGARLYTEFACAGCHSTDGTPRSGPTFKGLFGKTEELADGSKVQVDENYLRESILLANAKVVKGFAPLMPVFQGTLKEKQVTALIEFIKAQK